MWGAENQLLKWTKALSIAQHDITIFCRKERNAPTMEEINDSSTIYRLPTTEVPGLSMLLFMILLPVYMLKIHARHRFDLIHLPLPDVFITICYILHRLLKIPLISRIAADELYPRHSFGIWRFTRLLIRAFVLKSNAVHTLNPVAQKMALKWKKDYCLVYLIPNGIEVPDKQKLYSHLSRKIIYIGAMRYYPSKMRIEQKNLIYLIDAFSTLLKIQPEISLVMVGDGNYKAYLEEYSKSKGLHDKVVFEGYRQDIIPYLHEGDILVNPSHYEGLPNTVIEAMSVGMYVLCSDIPEHRFLIGSNIYGGLFDRYSEQALVDSILRFYEKPSEFVKKGEKARLRTGEKFSVDETMKQMVSMFSKVVHIN